MTYSFRRFKQLPVEVQIEQLNRKGVALDLACHVKTAEAVLFAYADFYVELIVAAHTDEILALKPFKSLKKLEPYLSQVDIGEITSLLSLSQ